MTCALKRHSKKSTVDYSKQKWSEVLKLRDKSSVSDPEKKHAGCSLMRAEGLFCSLDVLSEGLGLDKLKYWSKKKFFCCKFFQIFGHQNPRWIRIGIQPKMYPYPYQMKTDPKHWMKGTNSFHLSKVWEGDRMHRYSCHAAPGMCQGTGWSGHCNSVFGQQGYMAGYTVSGFVQGASGIDARFLKLSPALTVSPIMTKFSQYNPHSTCYLEHVSICRQD